MQTKPTPTEGQNSTKLEAESALRDADCSPSSLLRQRVVVRIETIEAESGKVIAAENHPHEFDCPLFDSAGGDKIHVTTLGRVVAATVASLAAELYVTRAAAEREIEAWKANHDNQVELKRIIAARPDLAERASMVERLVSERNALAAALRETLALLNHSDTSYPEQKGWWSYERSQELEALIPENKIKLRSEKKSEEKRKAAAIA